MNMNRYQAPNPEVMNSNNDEAFLTLLSSQRELLTQLNRESAERRTAGNGYPQGVFGTVTAGFDATYSAAMPMPMPTQTNLYPSNNNLNMIVTPNSSICEQKAPPSSSATSTSASAICDTVLYSRRFSLGLGNDYLGATTMQAPMMGFGDDLMKASGFGPDPIGCDIVPVTVSDAKDSNSKKRDKDDFGLDDLYSVKKRRLSNAALIQSIFLEEPQPQPQLEPTGTSIQRRLSLTSFAETGLELPAFLENTASDENEKEPTKNAGARATTTTPAAASKPKRARQPNKSQALLPLVNMDPTEARTKLMALSSAMEKSQKSQQDIHDWDRKMGLKRSHSKTMRLSTRSRKKLRAMLKKQITALNNSKKR